MEEATPTQMRGKHREGLLSCTISSTQKALRQSFILVPTARHKQAYLPGRRQHQPQHSGAMPSPAESAPAALMAELQARAVPACKWAPAGFQMQHLPLPPPNLPTGLLASRECGSIR